MACHLVLFWQRGEGRIRIVHLVAAAPGGNVPGGFGAGAVTLQPRAETLLAVLPPHPGLETILASSAVQERPERVTYVNLLVPCPNALCGFSRVLQP